MVRKKEEIIIEDSPYVKHSKENAMKISVADGASSAMGRNMSSSFITPFALAIGANGFHIGLMSSLSAIFGPLGSLRGSRLMEKHSRKKLLSLSKLLAIVTWVLIIGLAYLSWSGIGSIFLPYLLVFVYSIVSFYVWGIGNVAWFSWMGDLVPSKIRGKYFSRRNRTAEFIGLIVFIGGAFFLDFFKTKGFLLLGFALLFGLGIIFRLFSRYLIGKQFNPKFRVRRGHYFTFWSFIKNYDNYGKFAFFQAFFYFSVMISAPFFAVYMLNDLGFSYVLFTTVTLSTLVFYLIFSPLAGKFSDKFGNVKLLYISAFLFPAVPVLWIFLKSPISLIFLPGLISGIANATYVLGTTNFTYDAVSPQRRGLCFAYTGLLVGIGTALGALIGGSLIQFLDLEFIKSIFFVFGLSAFLMVLSSLFFLPQIKEERKTEKIKGLSVDIAHPFEMIHSDLVWFKNFIHGK